MSIFISMAFLVRDLWDSLQEALRILLKKPLFSLVAVLTLGLGIGANTAIFNVSYTALWRPLPYDGADRIVSIAEALRFGGENASGGAYLDWRDQAKSLESVAAFGFQPLNLTGMGEAERLPCAHVTREFFDVMGMAPSNGRFFNAEEDRPGAELVAVVTEAFWNRHFGAALEVSGRTVRLDDQTYAIIGVLDGRFKFPYSPETEVILPMRLDEEAQRAGEYMDLLRVVGRLKEGVSIEASRTELQIIRDASPGMGRAAGETEILLTGLQQQVSAGVRPALLVLVAVVGFLLLIACLNVANLLLARWTSRRREIWIRSALGASRGRLLQQYLAEGAVLSLLAASVALAMAWVGTRTLNQLIPSIAGGEVLRLVEAGLHPAMLWFTAGIALIIALFFAGLPLLATGWRAPPDSLGSSRSTASSRSNSRFRSGLMVAEVATALMLLVGSLLLLRSFQEIQAIDPGFRPDGVLTLAISLPERRYPEREQRRQFFEDLLDRLRGLPGVASAAMADALPLTSVDNMYAGIRGESQQLPAGQRPITRSVSISPGYTEAMGFRIVDGEALSQQWPVGEAPAVLINRQMARRIWPQEGAVGKRLVWGRTQRPLAVVVGVVEDVRHNGPTGEVQEEVYGHYRDFGNSSFAYVVLRTAGDPLGLSGPAKEVVRRLDPNQPVFSVQTMEERLSQSIAPQRFNLLLLALFAGLALILAAGGLYSVLSYSVAERNREIGVRIALGASHQAIMRMVVGKGALLTMLGLVLGAAGALALTRFMSSLLYGISATDPVTFVAAPLLLLGIAVAASWIPARKASGVDPIQVLRNE